MRKQEKQNSKNIIQLLFMMFILVQPIIDIITSLSINYLQVDFTAGVLIRFGMMAVGLIYIFFFPHSNFKKKSIIYLLILGLFVILNLANNFLVKSPISLGVEIRFIVKAIYFVAIFFSYLFVLQELRKKDNWERKIQGFITISMLIVGVSMVLAEITGTAFNSYDYNKIGHKGWFFAGNEIGAIMSICLPVVVLFAIKKTDSLKTSFYWIPTIFLMYSLMVIGTKVGVGAVIITIVGSLVMILIEMLRKNTSIKKINLLMNAIVIVGFILYFPHSPIIKNTEIHLSLLDQEKPAEETTENGQDIETPDVEQNKQENNKKPKLNDNQIENLVLSGRGQFLDRYVQYYQEAPFTQKILGMGYAGNYTDRAKLIEMDFHDLFFAFGIVGFLLYLLPFIIVFLSIAKSILFNLKTQFTIENVLISFGIILGLGIAFTAGHVLTAPAVSIYLAILLAYLYLRVKPIM